MAATMPHPPGTNRVKRFGKPAPAILLLMGWAGAHGHQTPFNVLMPDIPFDDLGGTAVIECRPVAEHRQPTGAPAAGVGGVGGRIDDPAVTGKNHLAVDR